MYNEILFIHKAVEEIFHLWQHGWTLKPLCSVKSGREREILYGLTYVWNLKKTKTKTKLRKRDQACGYQSTGGRTRKRWAKGTNFQL